MERHDTVTCTGGEVKKGGREAHTHWAMTSSIQVLVQSPAFNPSASAKA